MVDTDITPTEADDFLKLAKSLENSTIKSVVLDVGDTNEKRPGLLDTPVPSSEFGYQWVIIPRTGVGNYNEIQSYVDCQIKIGECVVTPTKAQTAQE